MATPQLLPFPELTAPPTLQEPVVFTAVPDDTRAFLVLNEGDTTWFVYAGEGETRLDLPEAPSTLGWTLDAPPAELSVTPALDEWEDGVWNPAKGAFSEGVSYTSIGM